MKSYDELNEEIEQLKESNKQFQYLINSYKNQLDEEFRKHNCYQQLVSDIQSEHIELAESLIKKHISNLDYLTVMISEMNKCRTESDYNKSYEEIRCRYERIISKITETASNLFKENMRVFCKNNAVSPHDAISPNDFSLDILSEVTEKVIEIQNKINECAEKYNVVYLPDIFAKSWIKSIATLKYSIGPINLSEAYLRCNEPVMYKKSDKEAFINMMHYFERMFADLTHEKIREYKEHKMMLLEKCFFIGSPYYNEMWGTVFDHYIYQTTERRCFLNVVEDDNVTYFEEYRMTTNATYSRECRKYYDGEHKFSGDKAYVLRKDPEGIHSRFMFEHILEKYKNIRKFVNVDDMKDIYEVVYHINKNNTYDEKSGTYSHKNTLQQTMNDEELNALLKQRYARIENVIKNDINYLDIKRNLILILNLLSSDRTLDVYSHNTEKQYPVNIKCLMNICYWFNQYKKGNISLSQDCVEKIVEMIDLIFMNTFEYSNVEAIVKENNKSYYYVGALEMFDNDDFLEAIKHDEFKSIRKKLNKLKLTLGTTV